MGADGILYDVPLDQNSSLAFYAYRDNAVRRRNFASECSSDRRMYMARRYSRGASKDVERAMRKRKRGTLRSGRSGKKVKSRKQAIAIGLSEARQKGKKVPRPKQKKRKS
jgi:hypothetical protein